MAQLGNTVVNGSLRVIGDFYANGYIDTTVTLTSSGWSGTDLFTQTVNVPGVKADNNYRVYQYISSGATAAEIKTYLKNFSYVVSGYATPADGSITFTTIKKPTANVTIRIVGDSNVERTTVENSEVTSMKSDIATINTSLNTLNTSKANLTETDLNTMINNLSVGGADAEGDDYIVCQYAGGGTTTTTYHRRKLDSFYSWVKSKQCHYISSKITSGSISSVGSLTYTATSNCVVYISYRITANSNGWLKASVDDVTIFDLSSNQAVQINMGSIPVFLRSGQKLVYTQSSNTESSYIVLKT